MKMKVQNAVLSVFLFMSLYPQMATAQSETAEAVTLADVQNGEINPASLKKKSETTYRLETFGSLTTEDKTPFWLQQHKWGMVPIEPNNYYLRVGAAHKQIINRKLSFELGLDLVKSSEQTNLNSFWLQQAYGRLNWKSLQLSVGLSEDYRSVTVDPLLSVGDFISSNNARPNPEIKISIPQFTAIPYTRKILYIKADLAVGSFLDETYLKKTAQVGNFNYTTGTLSHYKSLYFRIGNIDRFKNSVQVIFGADHYAQWGGMTHMKNGETVQTKDGLDGFLNALIPQGKTRKVKSSLGTTKTISDASHLASINLRIDYGKDYAEEVYSVYYQHPAENKSGLLFDNISDLLVGLQYKSQYRKLLSGVVLEYIQTGNQNATLNEDGSLNNNNNSLNNYYNSYTYFQGRSHFGMTLGSSIFLSPRFNNDGYIGFKSNRIMALHGALEGYLNDLLKYSLLGTYGKSSGTYANPYPSKKEGFAGMLNITYMFDKIPGFSITASGAFNSGGFFDSDSYGGGITIKKTGKLF